MKLFNKILIFIFFTGVAFNGSAQDNTVLTIQDAIQQTLEKNFGVTISKNEIEIGKINNNWANAGAIPRISATANKSIGTNNLEQHLSNGTITQKSGSSTQNFNAGVALNWTIFDGFKMFATKKRLEEIERRGEYAFRKDVNETIYNLTSGYFNIVTLLELVEATKEQISLYNERLTLTQRKFEIGTGPKYEVLEAEVDLNEQRSQLVSLENAIALAKSNLNNIMGRAPSTPFEILDTILIQPLPSYIEVEGKIEDTNPDMLLAKSDLLILMESKNEINAGRLPVVNLNGNYNFVRSRNGAGFTLLNQTYGPSGSIGVSIPIFNGGLVKKQLQVSDIQVKNQNLFIESVKNNLLTGINNAYISYNNALRAVEIEKNNLILAAENIQIATQRYRLLNITSVELRQIQISYNAIKNRMYNALYQAKMAETSIALLTGTISPGIE